MSNFLDHSLFIFDWDGTLSTSTLLVRLSRLFNTRYNVSGHEQPLHRRAVPMPDYRRMEAGLERKNIFYARLYDFYSGFSIPRLRNGSMDALLQLSRRGKRIAVFSDSEEYRLLHEAKVLGVIGKVDMVLSAKSIGYYKPRPEGLMLLMEKYKSDPGESIYVGDMASDVLTARLAGMHSCGIAGGLERYDILQRAKPDYLFKDMQDLAAYLKERVQARRSPKTNKPVPHFARQSTH